MKNTVKEWVSKCAIACISYKYISTKLLPDWTGYEFYITKSILNKK